MYFGGEIEEGKEGAEWKLISHLKSLESSSDRAED